MASKAVLIAMAMVATIFAPTMGKDLVVGDYKGWTLNFDYHKWAQGKEFHVGDTLVFNYTLGKHNVVKVNGTEFQQCAAPLTTLPLISGADVIPLKTPGNKWYICSVGSHSEDGPMKLAINVLPEVYSPSPAPQPGVANGLTVPSLMMAALVSLVVLIVT